MFAADDVSACGEAQLARNLVGVACGLQASLGCLVAALPALHQDRAALRASLAAARERAERLAHGTYLFIYLLGFTRHCVSL